MADEPMDFTQVASDFNSPTRGGRPQQGHRKVVVIPLCNDRQFTCQSTTFKYFLVGPRVLMGIGPQIEDIVGQARGKDFSANFTWKLVADKSVDGELWEQFSATIISVQSAAGQVVGPAHSTRVDYANNIRFALGVANGSGSATEIGNVTAYAAIKFWS